MEHYKNLEKAMCKELEKLDRKYTSDTEMTDQDAERADKLYHALKCAATYHAMKDAEEWEEEETRSFRNGRSYARTRDLRTGRYISRDPGYSAHYPMEYIDPYWDRHY